MIFPLNITLDGPETWRKFIGIVTKYPYLATRAKTNWFLTKNPSFLFRFYCRFSVSLAKRVTSFNSQMRYFLFFLVSFFNTVIFLFFFYPTSSKHIVFVTPHHFGSMIFLGHSLSFSCEGGDVAMYLQTSYEDREGPWNPLLTNNDSSCFWVLVGLFIEQQFLDFQ